MWIWLNALFMFTFFLVPVAGAATDASTCLGCHGSMEGSVRVDGEKFSSSVHGAMNDCLICHLALKGEQHQGLSGGKPDRAGKSFATANALQNRKEPIAQAACVSCHQDAYAAYTASVHGQNVLAGKSNDGPVCTSCHSPVHYLRPKTSNESSVNHFNIVTTCGVCHNQKMLCEKYGFSSQLMERYKESFHGRKLRVGDPRAPSCASCHGFHDIKRLEDASSPVAGPNKIKTCGKCHAGATEKFIAAITHKPLHPIAHFSERALIILMVSTFIFIILHVLLDIYADIRDRLFRKGGKHE